MYRVGTVGTPPDAAITFFSIVDNAASHSSVVMSHGFHPLPVTAIRRETDDSASFTFDVPGDLEELFSYRPGQFCTFRVEVNGERLLRCYSMSSAPEVDDRLTVTVKRVPGGAVSNWLLDNVTEGDMLEATRPAGVFCVDPAADDHTPVVAFCGGSGITPVMSITKSVLASTHRPVKILYANRDTHSVIFGAALARLVADHAGRLRVAHHLDSDRGYLRPDDVSGFFADVADGEVFLCGPEPFMDLVETTLVDTGIAPDRIAHERFTVPPEVAAGQPADPAGAAGLPESVGIILGGSRTDVAYRPGDTVLQTARRGGLRPPSSCEAGNCATCMALLQEGAARMRVNNALTPDEVREGWVLTCQALPEGAVVTVEYESF